MLYKGICFKISLAMEKVPGKGTAILQSEGNVLYVVTTDIEKVMNIVGQGNITDISREGIGYFNSEDIGYVEEDGKDKVLKTESTKESQ